MPNPNRVDSNSSSSRPQAQDPAAASGEALATTDEVEAALATLRGGDAGSLLTVTPLALQLPASVFAAAVEYVRGRRELIANEVAYLVTVLKRKGAR